jgi:hypothetical protein
MMIVFEKIYRFHLNFITAWKNNVVSVLSISF